MSQQHKRLKVILIGDSCIDEYRYGTVDRISPEAPVPVFVPNSVVYKNGMAANVAENLKTLGVDVASYFGSQSIKVRLIDEKSNQHLLRIDTDSKTDALSLDTHFPDDIDAIVISDYNKGLVSYELIEMLCKRNIPIFIDTKKTDLARMGNAFVKINELEFKSRSSDATNIIVTHGSQSVTYGEYSYNVPSVPTFDVCGAGDTFLSALVYQYLQTKDIHASIEFAIKASSVTVQHIGVYAPTLDEIL